MASRRELLFLGAGVALGAVAGGLLVYHLHREHVRKALAEGERSRPATVGRRAETPETPFFGTETTALPAPALPAPSQKTEAREPAIPPRGASETQAVPPPPAPLSPPPPLASEQVTRVQAPRVVLAEAKGVLAWEAEWANRLSGSYECLPMGGASGGAALYPRDGSGRSLLRPGQVDPRTPFRVGVAEFWIETPEEGSYRVMLRAWATDSCGDTCWVTVDGGRAESFPPNARWEGLEGGEGAYGKWQWMGREGPARHFARGAHRIRLDVREDGFAVDQIALVPEGSSPPEGLAAPNLMPLARSADGNETGLAGADAALHMESRILPDGAPHARLWLWLRNNSSTARRLDVKVDAPGAACLPSAQFAVELAPDAPVAHVRVDVRYPADVARRGHEVSVTITDPARPSERLDRRLVLLRPLDWRALGPLTMAQDAEVSKVLRDARAVDWKQPPLAGAGLAWTKVDPARHYDVFGTLSFERLYGAKDHLAAFIAARLHVEKAGDYRLLAGGDDTLHMRLDGARLLAQDRCFPLTDSLLHYPVALTAGDHWLVARVTQLDKRWEMHFEVQNADASTATTVWGLPAEP